MTLVEFLSARLDEDAAHLPEGFDCWYPPERYAAEVDAKRGIVDLLTYATPGHGPRRTPFGPDQEAVLRYLALPYADHPDYRREWAPA